MAKTKTKPEVVMASLDDLMFQATGESEKEPMKPQKYAKDSELHDFKDHPFKVEDNGDMYELVEDIRVQGIIYPLLVRERLAGGYEILAGHRRRFAGKKAGLKEYPIIIHNCNDTEATLIMVGSNKYRSKLKPSELAKAYKMERDALNSQGKRNDLLDENKESEEQSSKEISLRQKQRYIRLNYLPEELLDLVDDGKMTIEAAYNLSFLCAENMEIVEKSICSLNKVPSVVQSKVIVQLEEDEQLTVESVKAELLNVEVKENRSITIKPKKLQDYFPDNYSKIDMEEVIFKLLEQWKRDNTTSSVDINIPGQVDIEELDNGAYMPNGKDMFN